MLLFSDRFVMKGSVASRANQLELTPLLQKPQRPSKQKGRVRSTPELKYLFQMQFDTFEATSNKGITTSSNKLVVTRELSF